MVCRCGNQFCYSCGGPYPNCRCQAPLAQPLFRAGMRGYRNPRPNPGPRRVPVRPRGFHIEMPDRGANPPRGGRRRRA